MTELRMNLEKKFWNDLNNIDVMGTAPARKAESMVNFLNNLNENNGEYSCKKFDSYIEGMVRAYQFNEQDYEDVHIATTLDLHHIGMTADGLDNFIEYMKDEWIEYIEFARENGI